MGIEDELDRLLQQQNSGPSNNSNSNNNNSNAPFMGNPFAYQPPQQQQQTQRPPPTVTSAQVPVQQQAQSKNAMQTVLATFPKQEQAFILDLFKKMNSRQLDSATFARLLRDKVGIDKFQLVIRAIKSSYGSAASSVPPVSSVTPAGLNYLATNRETRSTSSGHPQQQQQHQPAVSMPSNPAPPAPASTTSTRQRSQTTSEPAPVDVNKMDSSLLQDVINYAGVDLKAESELIMKEAERANYRQQQQSAYSLRHQGAGSKAYVDESRKQSFIPTGGQLINLMRRTAKSAGLNQVEGDCDALLALATQQYLRAILEKCIKACRSRVEMGRDKWEIDLLDGEDITWRVDGEGRRSRIGAVKRPLVWLEKFEKAREARLAIHELKGSVSEEGRTAMVESGMVEGESAGGVSVSSQGAGGDKMEGVSPTAPTSATGSKKKTKAAADTTSAAESYWKEKDEQRIRTKLSNAAALQAIGMDKYSWMTAPTAATTSTATAPVQPTQQPAATTTTVARGGFALPRDDQRKKILNNRRITMTDLMYCATFIPSIKPQLVLKNR